MKKKEKDLSVVTPSELALVENNILNQSQLQFLLRRTPQSVIRRRPAKGGGEWEYVSGNYIRKVLNLMFGWNWDFEIIGEAVHQDCVIVKGRLTVRTGGQTIVKMQYGSKEIQYQNEYYTDENGRKQKRKSDKYLDIGSDFKAAATDCLKKCAAELGIAADVYHKEEFREVEVREITHEELEELYRKKLDSIPKDEMDGIQRILDNHETKSYSKLYNFLMAL